MNQHNKKRRRGLFTPIPRCKSQAPSSRRGVLLLVILGMLTLFLMIGTAFISSSNQYRRANKSYSKVGEQKNLEASQEGFLGEVINQLIRDTGNQNSAMRFHSLLRDMYGTEGFIATIPAGGRGPMVYWAGAGPASTLGDVTNGQMIEFQITPSTVNLFSVSGGALQPAQLSKIENYYNGCTLTFLDGVGKGRSTRLVGFYRTGTADNSAAVFRVLSFPLENGSLITNPNVLAGSRILINGRPFNGTGVGYNAVAASTEPKLNAKERVEMPSGTEEYEIALMPNAAFFEPSIDPTIWSVTSPSYYGLTAGPIPLNVRHYDGLGGSDETYDAPDFQNMFLAWTSPNPQETVLRNITAEPSSLGSMVLPSFHRPELINYWARRTTFLPAGDPLINSTLGDAAALLRKVFLRPNWLDHPDFTGSNPELAATTTNGQKVIRMIYGPWDVDNDNDGVRDSIWVDFGAPVMVGSKGKLVKPLAAIMVLDMDGRLNVNAHGTADIQSPENFNLTLAGNVNSDTVPQGQAFGPAEISLRPVVGNRFSELLRGDTIFGTSYPGRYAQDDEPGQSDRFDLSAQLKMQGLPTYIPNTTALARSNFGTLPDLRARYAVGLNDFGQSVVEWNPNDFVDKDSNGVFSPGDAARLDEDNPYELDISSTGARGEGSSVDNPFSLAELERVLRAYDLDAGTLSPRLFELLRGSDTTMDPSRLREFRTLLTTDSYDLPEPGVQLPAWVRTNALGAGTDFATVMRRQPVNATFADLIEYRIRAARNWPVPATGPDTNIAAIRRIMNLLVAPEMMAGLKLDLNRPLGNGRDENINGVVDEPGEYFDADNDGSFTLGEDEGALWLIDYTRAGVSSTAATGNFEDPQYAIYRDEFDRNSDGMITDDEWGDTNLDGSLSQVELVNLHNYRRQLLARHLYVLAMAVVDPFVVTTTEGKAKARQLAQWAINAVDFRDPDNIMTAFEFDENPFDGWNVDGNVANTHGPDGIAGNADDDVANQREVVWGMEKPELLMTEAIAWHDRRTTDTAREEIDAIYTGVRTNSGTLEDSNPDSRDPHLDQQYRPKGAAFIELYNPSAASPGASADTHAIQGVNFTLPGATAGADLGVNLSAVAVDPNDASRRSPVWRVQVVRNRKKTGVAYGNDLNEMLLFYDPEDRWSLSAANRPDVDRTIYFAQEGIGAPAAGFPNNAPLPGSTYQTLDSTDGVEFYTDLPIRPVRPGSYMVVGSGDERTPGSNVYTSPISLTYVNGDPTASGKIGRRIELHAGVNLNGTIAPVQIHTSTSDPAPLLTPQLAGGEYVADVAIINRVIDRSRDGIVQGPTDRNFSLSEPFCGYPTRMPGMGSVWSTSLPSGGPEVDGWYVNGPNSTVPLPIDIPLDDNETAVRPVDPDLRTYGTVQGYRWLYLQRLANPLLPFNPESGQPGHDNSRPVNPYLTIDHSSVNLSVFNGMINSAIVTPSVNPEYGSGPLGGELSSIERGWRNDPADLTKTLYAAQHNTTTPTDPNNSNPYNVETSGKRPRNNTRFPAGGGHFFNAMPDCSLGHLNQGFAQNYVTNKVTPNQPYPWLTWSNRPFANPGELMQVPSTRSSQLMRAFSMLAPASVDNNLKSEVFIGSVNKPPVNNSNTYYNLFSKYFPLKDGPFGHLLNFFRTDSKGVDNAAGTADDQGIAGLHRVLDFVAVPSLFVGSETWLNPQQFGLALPTNATTADPRYGLQPPFNKVSSRREPGRVNLNTIARKEPGTSLRGGKAVWDSLFQGNTKRDGSGDRAAHPAADDDDFFLTRRGYWSATTGPGTGSKNDENTLLNKDFPTFFANPFRPAGTGSLVPINEMIRTDLDTGLNRSFDGTSGANAQSQGQPFSTTATIAPSQAFRNSHRNPYFRYSPISRLSSMTTTRSNVFAVWVTIGFFEVEEVEPWASLSAADQARYGTVDVYNRVYPDGYRFGKEDGIETGEVERVREFAIIDRTIPVAFEPGANHNAQETIRLRRKIE